MSGAASLLAAHAASRSYPGAGGRTASKLALDQVSLDLAAGESVALLGRSGCGKSTLARLLVGLERPDAGAVLFEGRDIGRFGGGERRAMLRAVQMVFQDSVGAVDPRATVAEIIGEPLRHLCGLGAGARREQARELLESVELDAADLDKLPQQMSGGQLQRVCIARALAPRPQLVILDEAVSNLDLHLQIQMLDLFARLRESHGVSWLFITHDLRLAARFCNRALVMDAGRIVEEARLDGALRLTSPEGMALQGAVLPAWPLRRNKGMSGENGSPAPDIRSTGVEGPFVA